MRNLVFKKNTGNFYLKSPKVPRLPTITITIGYSYRFTFLLEKLPKLKILNQSSKPLKNKGVDVLRLETYLYGYTKKHILKSIHSLLRSESKIIKATK